MAEDYVQQCEEIRARIFKGYADIKAWEVWSKADGITQDMHEETIEYERECFIRCANLPFRLQGRIIVFVNALKREAQLRGCGPAKIYSEANKGKASLNKSKLQNKRKYAPRTQFSEMSFKQMYFLSRPN